MINENNYTSFNFQRYDNRSYNRINILNKQASELTSRGLQYVLNGYCGNGISNPVLFNPSPQDIATYIETHRLFYTSYYLEIAYPKDAKVVVKTIKED